MPLHNISNYIPAAAVKFARHLRASSQAFNQSTLIIITPRSGSRLTFYRSQ